VVEIRFCSKFGQINGGAALVARQFFLDLITNFMELNELVVLRAVQTVGILHFVREGRRGRLGSYLWRFDGVTLLLE